MSTTTYSLTMAHLKPDDAESSLWQGYSLHAPTPASAPPPTFETSSYAASAMGVPFQRQPQKGNYRSMDAIPTHARPAPGDLGGPGVLTTSPPPLSSHSSYPSLKRPFQPPEHQVYGGEPATEFRDDLPEPPKVSISHEHRLLSFSRSPEKHTILDSHGRVQQIELAAQIHGMFFLSEMTAPSGEGMVVQPELTCYRRNLFQISGTATTPRGPLSVITERGERIPIASMEVAVSATESVDGHSVKLIVIPWKTPPPKSPEVNPGQEHEPAPIPLQPLDVSSPEGNADFSVYPISYRRLQFRIATANNGRRRELQQHFTLHLDVVATLANDTKVNICETTTAPIVVRGRSPRNFQSRKEIPLLGSSASRGGPPELHAVPGLGIAAPAQAEKSSGPKGQNVDLQRSGFSFEGLPPTSGVIRQSTFPTYLPSHTPEQRTAPNTPGYQTPLSIDNYLQVNQPSPTAGSQLPIRQPPYGYAMTSSPPQIVPQTRFVDTNPRPSKSPRHVAPSELPANPSYPEQYGRGFAQQYGSGSEGMEPRGAQGGHFQPSMSMQAWTGAPDTSGIYGAPMRALASNLQEQYQFSGEAFPKSDGGNQPSNYSWSSS